MASAQDNYLVLADYAWPDTNLPRRILFAQEDPETHQAEDLQLGRAVLTEDPPPTTEDGGDLPPPEAPPPPPVDHGRGRPKRPPRWRRILWWIAIMMLAYIVGMVIGAFGVHQERKWGWR